MVDPFFFHRIEYAHSKGLKTQTNVNSKMLTKTMTDKLLNSDLDELFISCNDDGEDNVKYLILSRTKKTPKIYLSFIRGETKPYKLKINPDGVSVSYPHNWGGEKGSSLPSYRDPCRLLWVTMYVTWNGLVHLCCMDIEAKHVIGDTKKDRLQNIWHKNNPLGQTIHKMRRFDEIECCNKCMYNQHNRGGWWV